MASGLNMLALFLWRHGHCAWRLLFSLKQVRALTIAFAMLATAAIVPSAAAAEHDAESRETQQAVKTETKQRSKRERPAPKSTFTPTEKIQADSAVSFPVDI